MELTEIYETLERMYSEIYKGFSETKEGKLAGDYLKKTMTEIHNLRLNQLNGKITGRERNT